MNEQNSNFSWISSLRLAAAAVCFCGFYRIEGEEKTTEKLRRKYDMSQPSFLRPYLHINLEINLETPVEK